MKFRSTFIQHMVHKTKNYNNLAQVHLCFLRLDPSLNIRETHNPLQNDFVNSIKQNIDEIIKKNYHRGANAKEFAVKDFAVERYAFLRVVMPFSLCGEFVFVCLSVEKPDRFV